MTKGSAGATTTLFSIHLVNGEATDLGAFGTGTTAISGLTAGNAGTL